MTPDDIPARAREMLGAKDGMDPNHLGPIVDTDAALRAIEAALALSAPTAGGEKKLSAALLRLRREMFVACNWSDDALIDEATKWIEGHRLIAENPAPPSSGSVEEATGAENAQVEQCDYELAEEIVSAANIVSHDGYYEIDIDRAAAVISAHRLAALKSPAVESLQSRVQPWMMECFGPAISADRVERGDRLLEEIFELLQSGDYDPSRIPALVEYVWSRPIGEPAQEAGGSMVTLAAYCLAHGLDMHDAGEAELARILRPEVVQKIRAKQALKARDIPFSPLPAPPQGSGS